jgi:hypothetical protein
MPSPLRPPKDQAAFHYGLGSAETKRPEALGYLTPTGRPKCYLRKRNSDQALIRLKEVRIDIARRQVRQIEAMITDLDCTAATLEKEIGAEQNRTGIRDPAHFAYSTLAKAAIVRRSNLESTVPPRDRAAGYRYQLSILQAEFSLTQVLDQPVTGRIFFEEVIRENLDIGRPSQVSLVFDRKVSRRTSPTTCVGCAFTASSSASHCCPNVGCRTDHNALNE